MDTNIESIFIIYKLYIIATNIDNNCNFYGITMYFL